MKLLTVGTLHQKPVTLTAKSGNEYTKAILKEVKGDATSWINLTAFDSNGVTLAGLNAGDSLSVSGDVSISVYQPGGREVRPSIGLVVEQIITMKKQPSSAPKQPARKPAPAPQQQSFITTEAMQTARERRDNKTIPATGNCQHCGAQPVDGVCPECPF
jgi:hypothetical protein